MIRFPLRLVPADAPLREAAGWFVAGESAASWLAEMAGWGVPLERATLRLVPHGAADRRPCGALVTLPAGLHPRTGPRAEAWGVIGGRLWLPCRARLEPAATETELAAALPGEAAALHPSAGLVAFGPADTLRAADLLELPPPRAADWSAARPGVAAGARLSSAEPADPPRLEIVLAEGKGDIGSGEPGKLPPAPGERPPARGVGGWLQQKMFSAIHWFAQQGSKTPEGGGAAAGSGWMEKLRGWSAEKLAKFAADLRSAREKEIDRLLHLLARDPDAGLKFALPMSGGAGARGLAPPGAVLGPRNTDFSLSRLGGGRAADPWDIESRRRQELVKRYRELALRELRLGRHRRAAYIFAELLGDDRAAADALAEGRHYREAAVLYRDRLKQPLAAAQCLEKGGLLLDAIPLYEAEGRWETAGDLYARLERPEDAARDWRRAGDAHRERGDILAAGRLLESKLAAPDEALALYEQSWPWSHQAGPALDARFALLGRLGRHDAAADLVARLVRELPARSRIPTLAEALATAAGAYPERRVRDRAADAARVAVGRFLPKADPAETADLLKSVARLRPHDRLLVRDAARWPARRRAPAPPPRPRDPAWTPLLAFELHLPPDILWETAAARRDLLYVSGFGKGGAVLARAPWTDAVQMLTWTPDLNYPHILEPGLDAARPVLFAGSPGPRLGLLSFPATGAVSQATPAGTPPWFPDEVLAAAVAELGTVWVVREHLGRLVVWAYTQNGSISAIYPLPQLEEALPEGESLRSLAPLPAAAQRLNVFVALGRRLARLGRDGAIAAVDLPEPVTALAASTPSVRPMIAAAFAHGGAVVFDSPDLGAVKPFGDDLAEPLVTFTRDATLIAVGEREGRVYDTADGRVIEKAAFPVLGGRPVAAVPGAKANEFALVMPGGEVRVYAVR